MPGSFGDEGSLILRAKSGGEVSGLWRPVCRRLSRVCRDMDRPHKKIVLFGLTATLVMGAAIAFGQSAAAHKVTEISLERTPCFGGCPVYTVTFSSDGTVKFKGVRYVDKIGDYEGRVDPEEFVRLAKALDKLDYWNLDKKYTEPITDMPSQYVRVMTPKGLRTVHNYGRKAPDEFFMVTTMIDGALHNVRNLEKVEKR